MVGIEGKNGEEGRRKESGNWEADENTIVSYFWDIIIRKMQKSVKNYFEVYLQSK